MQIGEIVERLISIRDRHFRGYPDSDGEAIIEACNLLDKLPRMVDAFTYTEVLSEIMRNAKDSV